jgi:cob(I)alamin adenosyltransferase
LLKPELKTGLVQVYTGNGKGKTTAALGLALRAVGHGFRVLVVQFLKGSTFTGEIYSAQRLYPLLEVMQFGRNCQHASLIKEGFMDCVGCGQCFVSKTGATELDKQKVTIAYRYVEEVMQAGAADIIVLDEIFHAMRQGLLTVGDVLGLIRQKPSKVELILTGRGAPEEIIEAADLVTEMREIKHPLATRKIAGRRGIEY